MAEARRAPAIIDDENFLRIEVLKCGLSRVLCQGEIIIGQLRFRRDRIDNQRDFIAMRVDNFIGVKLVKHADFDIFAGPAQSPLAARIGVAAGNRQIMAAIKRRMGVD